MTAKGKSQRNTGFANIENPFYFCILPFVPIRPCLKAELKSQLLNNLATYSPRTNSEVLHLK
ncbi:hypothetical protein VroAM7_37860 [Vibrio rotiferianus]|uniref:Uncharacterized protein n=1 Tax=Vibrio rotiferianus TaxID=190895 RepID=A0A510IBI1_9VIBR|nr:hypothetical protein VroAM7_37860 [Vibrio rotiferianus]